MIPRHQLAVAPRISPVSLVRAGAATCTRPATALALTSALLCREFGALACTLTDSGTSALVLALRIMVGQGGIVALPGYGCVDLAAAVRFAGTRVRLYDVDPATLSPDLDSVELALRRGVDAVLVAHYYGYPADVPAVKMLASRYGVPVLEDAAQAAGGSLAGNRLGALGDLSILSFGRGKGLFGGRGGALLTTSALWSARVESLPALQARRGISVLAGSAVQWMLARPEVYALPASIPSLHLGEMVYHAAREPEALSLAAAALVRTAISEEPRERQTRSRVARLLRAAVGTDNSDLLPIQPIAGAEPGYLRFAVIDRSDSRDAAPRLGVMRGYPRGLQDQQELIPSLVAGEPSAPGARQLCASLFTLPTHHHVAACDLLDLQEWIGPPSGKRAPTFPSGSASMADESVGGTGWSSSPACR